MYTHNIVYCIILSCILAKRQAPADPLELERDDVRPFKMIIMITIIAIMIMIMIMIIIMTILMIVTTIIDNTNTNTHTNTNTNNY